MVASPGRSGRAGPGPVNGVESQGWTTQHGHPRSQLAQGTVAEILKTAERFSTQCCNGHGSPRQVPIFAPSPDPALYLL